MTDECFQAIIPTPPLQKTYQKTQARVKFVIFESRHIRRWTRRRIELFSEVKRTYRETSPVRASIPYSIWRSESERCEGQRS